MYLTDLQVRFMGLSERLWIQIHVSVIRRRITELSDFLDKLMHQVSLYIWMEKNLPIFCVYLLNRYQMDPANYREALLEIRTDEEEGADILMVISLF